MNTILKNLIINKNDNYNDLINITFWILFFVKNNLKFILTIFFIIEDIPNIILLIFLLIFPTIKFILIGVKNIKIFRKSVLKRTNFLVIITFISKIYY